MQNLGAGIQVLRKRCHLTLKVLAEKIGVTSSFLSQVEKGKASPSLATLKRIADALDTTVSFLVAEPDKAKQSPVLRQSARSVVEDPSNNLVTQVLTSPQSWKMMEPMLFTFTRSSLPTSVRYRHVGDEFALVLKGRLKVVLNEENHILGEGDSIYFSSGIPHVFMNATEGETEVLSINTPPNF